MAFPFIHQQDDMGWTPLMIAASVKDSERLVGFLLSKGADPNEKSEIPPSSSSTGTGRGERAFALPYLVPSSSSPQQKRTAS